MSHYTLPSSLLWSRYHHSQQPSYNFYPPGLTLDIPATPMNSPRLSRSTGTNPTPKYRQPPPYIKFDPFSDENAVDDIIPSDHHHHQHNHRHHHHHQQQQPPSVLYRTPRRNSVSFGAGVSFDAGTGGAGGDFLPPSLPPPPRPPRRNNNPFLTSSSPYSSPYSTRSPPASPALTAADALVQQLQLYSSATTTTTSSTTAAPAPAPKRRSPSPPALAPPTPPTRQRQRQQQQQRTAPRSTTSTDLDRNARSKLVAGILLNRVHAVGKPMRPRVILQAIDLNGESENRVGGGGGVCRGRKRAYVKSCLSRVVAVEA